MTDTLSSDAVIEELGYTREVSALRHRIETWLESVDPELRQPLSWALGGAPKHFRPLTVFASHRALHDGGPSASTVDLAFAVELMHNMTLIIDDVLDESDERRGIATVERRFGRLSAQKASG
jgi:geranylgeranyl diphosphate synthase type I